MKKKDLKYLSRRELVDLICEMEKINLFVDVQDAFGRKRGTFYRCSRKRICISCCSGRGTDSAECGGHDKRRVAAQPFYLYCGWQEPGDGAL